MRCYICDRVLNARESTFNEETGKFDAICTSCSNEVFETVKAYGTDGYTQDIEDLAVTS